MNLKLSRSRQRMTDQSPLNEITAMIDRGTGEVFKCRGHEEEVAVNADDGGVWVEAGDDGVGETHGFVKTGDTLSDSDQIRSDQIMQGFICGGVVVFWGPEI